MWDILNAVFLLATVGLTVAGLYIRSGQIAGHLNGGKF
jgi:hypothetical protein